MGLAEAQLNPSLARGSDLLFAPPNPAVLAANQPILNRLRDDAATSFFHVGSWHGDGSTFVDASPAGNDGQLGNGMGSNTPDFADGIYTLASASSEYMQIGDDDGLDIGAAAELTVVWVGTQTAAATNARLFNKLGSTGYDCYFNNTDIRFFITDSSDTHFGIAAAPSSGEMMVVIARVTAANVRLRVSGTNSTPTARTAGSCANTNVLYVGRRAAGNYYNGNIHAFIVMSRALTDDECAAVDAAFGA